MTISTIPANDRRELFTASPGQTVFPFDFPLYAATDLRVVRIRGALAVPLTLGADYALSGAGQQAGGNITLTSGAEAGDILLLDSAMPIGRTSAFADGGDLPAAGLNGEFNRLIIMMQQVQRQIAETVRVPTDEPPAARLPSRTDRAGRFAAYDSEGNPTVAIGAGTGDLVVTPLAEALLADNTPEGMAVRIGAARAVQHINALADVAAATVPAGAAYIRTAGRLATGDGGEGLYRREVSEPAHALKIQSLDGAWWGASPREVLDIRELRWGGLATAAEQAQSLNEAVTYLDSRGGGEIVLPPGTYDISSQAICDKPFVRIRGAGAPADSDYVAQTWATRLRWTGASGASMIAAAPVSGATSRRLFGFGLRDVFLDGNLLAARGLEARSLLKGHVHGVMFTKFSGASGALYTGVVGQLGAGEARDLQDCRFEDLSFRQLADEGTSDCIRLDGDATANTSFNMFRNIMCKHHNNHGFVWGNSDNNLLEYFRAFRPSGTGYGMIFNADAALLRTSRTNRVLRTYCQGGVLAQGTGTAANPSYNNIIVDYDLENGSPPPTIDTGASLEWWSDYIRVRTGTSGAKTMANGMVEQWGANVVGGGLAIGVTLPLALAASGGYSAMATILGSGGVAYASPCQAQIAADGATIILANISVESATIAWRAIGRVA